MPKQNLVEVALAVTLLMPAMGIAGGLPPVDLSLTLADSPDPVGAGQGADPVSRLMYRATITNPADDPATDVVLRVPFVHGLVYDAPPLPCFLDPPDTIVCQYTEVAAHSQVEVAFGFQVPSSAPSQLAPPPATVSSANPDPNSLNNSAAATTTVWPIVSANCFIGVVEGDLGTTPLPCRAYRSGPRAGTVTTGYSVLTVTATPGVDYVPASGTLTFPPGSDEVSFDVLLIGDTHPEGTDTFVFSLSPAPGAFAASVVYENFIFDDDSPAVRSGLSHGFRHRGDLTSAFANDRRVDFFHLRMEGTESYEIVADEVSGDAGGMHIAVLTNSFPQGVLRSRPVGTGGAASLRFVAASNMSPLVWAEGLGCGVACGPDDTYRLRAYETTLTGGRFDLVGHESVLVLQNASNDLVTGRLYFWNLGGAGTNLAFEIPARGSLVRRLADLPGPVPLSGSMTVAHDAAHGKLVGKVSTFDPVSGFSFDSMLLPKPR